MDQHDDARINRWVEDRLQTLAPEPAWQPDPTVGLRRCSEAQTASAGRRRTWSLTIAAALIAGLCVSAFPTTRVFAARCVAACVGQASRASQVLKDRIFESDPVATVGTEVGSIAPDFTRPDASGNPVALSRFRGQVVLLNFWATWCAPCAAEMPWFEEFQRTYASQGFNVVGVSLDEEGWDVVKPFLTRTNIAYPIVLGDDALTGSYGDVTALPRTLLIDRSGRIAAIQVGLVEKGQYERAIRSVLAR